MLAWGICVFLSALGLGLLAWCLTGWALLPARRESRTVWLLSGPEPELERQMRAFAFARGCGLAGGRLLLVDCGMDPGAIRRAQALCAQHAFAELLTQDPVRNRQQECVTWNQNPS